MCPHDPLPDSIGGRYRVVSQVGTGGMGIVYKATDTKLNRPVAIKAIHSHRIGDRRGRLRAEALAAASIDHPYLCKVYEFVEEGEEAFLVMEFVEGETLSTVLARGVPPIADSLAIVSEILQGLATAHGHGLVHRDVKPSNVMVTSNGHVKLLDFGLARADAVITPAESTRTSPADGGGDHAGTPHYMAPEQAMGRPVTSRSDLFSVGALLYECLTGHLPFAGSSGYDYVRHMLSDDPRPIARVAPKVPVDLARLVYRCLEKTPANRPESADEMLGEVRRIAAALSHSEVALPTAGAARTRRHLWQTSLVAALGVLVIFIGWNWLSTPTPELSSGRYQRFVTWGSVESDSRVSPDGQSVAFISDRDGLRRLFIQPTSGGSARPVRLAQGRIESYAWSPDGTELACLLRQGSTLVVHVAPKSGGPSRLTISLEPLTIAHRLVRWVGEVLYVQARSLQRISLQTGAIEDVSARWNLEGTLRALDVSPLGSRVVYAMTLDGQEDLWIANLDGTDLLRLTNDDYFDRSPIFRGSEDTIVFQSNRGGPAGLWEISPGASARLLTSGDGSDTPGGTSLDGSVLSFTRATESSMLWRFGLGNRGEPLTTEAPIDLSPALSADGLTIVFQRVEPDSSHGFRLLDSTLVVGSTEAEGVGELRPVAKGYSGMPSPDGGHIAFLQDRSTTGLKTLVIMELSTERPTTVASEVPVPIVPSFHPFDWADRKVTWGPTGDELFFVDGREAESLRRYDLESGLTEAPIYTAEPGERIRDPYLSPDGRQLAFLTYRQGQYVLRGRDLLSGRDYELGSIPGSSTQVFGRGWIAASDEFVLLRRGEIYADSSVDVEIFLASQTGQPRRVKTLDHTYIATVRLDGSSAMLYLTRSADGVHNLYSVSLGSQDIKPVSFNTMQGVTFSGINVLPNSIVAAREEYNRDIWIWRTETEGRSQRE